MDSVTFMGSFQHEMFYNSISFKESSSLESNRSIKDFLFHSFLGTSELQHFLPFFTWNVLIFLTATQSSAALFLHTPGHCSEHAGQVLRNSENSISPLHGSH